MIFLSLDPNTQSTGVCIFNTETGSKLYKTLAYPRKWPKKNWEHARAAITANFLPDHHFQGGELSEFARMNCQRHLLQHIVACFEESEELKGFKIEELERPVDLAIIEDVFVKDDPRVPVKIRECAAYIIADLVKDRIYMTASQWRGKLFGKTKRDDEQTLKLVARLVKETITNIDEATAICIMEAYLRSIGRSLDVDSTIEG